MAMSDTVHWRDDDGPFWSSSMGLPRTGRWPIEDDELRIDLAIAADSSCCEVWASGNNIELTPTGPGLVIRGVIEKTEVRN
jgi:hypothetical protein